MKTAAVAPMKPSLDKDTAVSYGFSTKESSTNSMHSNNTSWYCQPLFVLLYIIRAIYPCRCSFCFILEPFNIILFCLWQTKFYLVYKGSVSIKTFAFDFCGKYIKYWIVYGQMKKKITWNHEIWYAVLYIYFALSV